MTLPCREPLRSGASAVDGLAHGEPASQESPIDWLPAYPHGDHALGMQVTVREHGIPVVPPRHDADGAAGVEARPHAGDVAEGTNAHAFPKVLASTVARRFLAGAA